VKFLNYPPVRIKIHSTAIESVYWAVFDIDKLLSCNLVRDKRYTFSYLVGEDVTFDSEK
jgi:hypothetical protein